MKFPKNCPICKTKLKTKRPTYNKDVKNLTCGTHFELSYYPYLSIWFRYDGELTFSFRYKGGTEIYKNGSLYKILPINLFDYWASTNYGISELEMKAKTYITFQ